ncbi:hypothetical protein XHV734_1966 [Xanthomonas hortorum pv. vitians]|nr:hypothetical protein [Xanthomonas hortorum]MCE4299985.1 hypothetical protein [Xanthomonas hortorum pv. vitians]MCE4368812.1 hypothetical protein [Xanthomonas hortorum pv. vitians]MCE4530006.1 hypothetical protein [Xanthomonas hortorum pv. vitians]MCE4551784.1 hypothetical protein [Xanthomonas hortorum pv. vitians]QNM60760.1 hypothetical protein XHV734_1966 [Xanthomonas hortorum pv. vitians]
MSNINRRPLVLVGIELRGVDNHSSQTERKSITGDPDVDEVLYALGSKNELAIEQALNRVANSAATQALLKKGNDFLEA